MKGMDFTGIAYLVAIGIAAYIAYQVWQKGPAAITEAAKSVVDAINPASSTNIVNRATNAMVETATGRKDDTLGSWFYDLINPDPMQVMKQVTEAQIARNNASLSGMDSTVSITDLMTQMP